jgi:hypothetical protein
MKIEEGLFGYWRISQKREEYKRGYWRWGRI